MFPEVEGGRTTELDLTIAAAERPPGSSGTLSVATPAALALGAASGAA